jgi:DNA (cytosine-5)-methyltransferase 1
MGIPEVEGGQIMPWPAQVTPTLNAAFGSKQGLEDQHIRGGAGLFVPSDMAVRRLTPRECERLQGFPNDYTAIPYRGKSADQCPDGPRYKALGNSMAVPVMAWIGRRIDMVDRL